MVATILAAILKELRGEMKTLENLKAVVNDFTHLKSSIQPWLEVRPNLESITERRKAIRGLKSKLRHKEADRQDLEEVTNMATFKTPSSICIKRFRPRPF